MLRKVSDSGFWPLLVCFVLPRSTKRQNLTSVLKFTETSFHDVIALLRCVKDYELII